MNPETLVISFDSDIYYSEGFNGQGLASIANSAGNHISIFNPFPMDYFTISFWANAVIDHNKTYGDSGLSVWHDRTDLSQQSFGFALSSGNHPVYRQHEYPELIVSDDSNNLEQGKSLYYGKNQLNEKEWQNILLTYSAGVINIYANGIPIIQNKITLISPQGRNLDISLSGKDKIDEFRIYNRALSEPEIQELYNEGSTPNGEEPETSTLPASEDIRNLIAGARYQLKDNEIVIANPAMYTGAFVQFDSAGSVLSIHLVEGSNTSWFARKYTDPSQWASTFRNFVFDQTVALFRGDFEGVIWSQSNQTTIPLVSTVNRIEGMYLVGGTTSLLLDTVRTVFDVLPIDSFRDSDLLKAVILDAYSNQNLLIDVESHLDNGNMQEAFGVMLGYVYNKIIEHSGSVFTDIAVQAALSSMESDFGLSINPTGKFISTGLSAAQSVAKGLDAAGQAALHYYGDIPMQKATIILNKY